MRVLLSLIVVLAVAAGAVAVGALLEAVYFAQPGPSASETTVLVKPGTGLIAIADQLVQAEVVENALLFRAGVMRRGRVEVNRAPGEVGRQRDRTHEPGRGHRAIFPARSSLAS